MVLACYAAIALGTLSGGWRIVKTMGSKITKLRPVGGFCAETAAAITLFANSHLGIPVSTTHTITGRDHRRGRHAAPLGGPVGHRHPHRLGLGDDHPGLGGGRLPRVPRDQPVSLTPTPPPRLKAPGYRLKERLPRPPLWDTCIGLGGRWT